MVESSKAKIVLQHRASNLYFKGNDEWTAHVNEAVQFDHIADANAFARRAKLLLHDIVMSFGDPKYDVRLNAWE
jgi:predicted lipid-binding transport protein (Tim44 family)